MDDIVEGSKIVEGVSNVWWLIPRTVSSVCAMLTGRTNFPAVEGSKIAAVEGSNVERAVGMYGYVTETSK